MTALTLTPWVRSLADLPDTRQAKRLFADAWLRCLSDPFRAAMSVFPAHSQLALEASRFWPLDPEVLAFQTELIAENGEDAYLPSKAAMVQRAMSIADDQSASGELKLKALELAAKLRNFMPKTDGTGTTVNVNNNRVMIVKDYGDAADWENAAGGQQARLIASAGL